MGTRIWPYNVCHSKRKAIFCWFNVIKWLFHMDCEKSSRCWTNSSWLSSQLLSGSLSTERCNITRLCSLSPQFDMQQMSLEELKQVLFHAFRDHLTMKDIENIIVNEEESLKDSSGNCHTEFEGGEWSKECFTVSSWLWILAHAYNQELQIKQWW